METTATGQVCLNYMAICKRAIGTLQRRGICEWVERDELISEGCLALSMRNPADEALAVKIARDAMIDTIRKAERRERGRVEVRGAVEDAPEGDRWDTTVYGNLNLRPVNTHPDLWDALKTLPARQHQAVTLAYWGGMSETQIGIEMRVSRVAAHALLKKAEINLRTGVSKSDSHTVTKMRGKEAPRAALSCGVEAA